MKKKGFTLIELLVVIAIIAMLMAILMPALTKVKKIASRVVCGTNLKGLGTAQTVYAHDYDDEYAVQGGGGNHTWSDRTTGWQNTTTNVSNTDGVITVGASLYLLVREADVSPKSFICPSGNQQEFSGKNANNLDIVELYDFGDINASLPLESEGPGLCVSYAYHTPYTVDATDTGRKSRYAADGTRSAAFAVMADRNPYFDDMLTIGGAGTADLMPERVGQLGPGSVTDWDDIEKFMIQRANAQPHDREGQNVLFADGHTANEKRPDVGVKYDNIYTHWAGTGTTEADRRQGDRPAAGAPEAYCDPLGLTDSMLINDERILE
jgi:prepilin-type N-terminal cleavage/methylation domain-containing protein/prepilin-type processing-associated H-X9-DG protein